MTKSKEEKAYLLRKFVLTLLFLLPTFSLTLQADPKATRIDFYYGIAQGNYLIGDLEGAARGVSQILKLNPNHTPALTLNARILMDQNQPKLALESAERAIAIEPENPEHQILKTLVLGNLDCREEAIRVAREVIRSTPEQSKNHRVASKVLGLFLMAEDDLDEAAKTFSQSYLNNPEAAQGNLALAGEAYLRKAQQALAQNDFKTALEAIDQALKLLDQNPDTTNFQQRSQLNLFRARILTQSGRVDEAIHTLQKIANQRPEELEALVTLASLYASTKKWELLEDILPLIPARPGLQDIALYLEGRIALANERVGTARKAFESALRLLPDGKSKLRSSLEFYLGVCLLEINRIEEGDSKIMQSLDNEFNPETAEEMILASRTLLRDQQPQRAITYLEAVTLNQITDSIQAWNLLGRAHLANNSTALALSAFNQSLNIQPQQSDTLALRSLLLRKLGDLSGATVDLRNALDLDPGNPALTYSLGLIYLQIGKIDEAHRSICASAKKLPTNPGLSLLRALLAYNTESYQESQTALYAYFKLVPEQANESAFYLEYILNARVNSNRALEMLQKRVEASEVSPFLANYLEYIRGTLDQKAVLDRAGRAEDPETARQQLCEIAYWLAQYASVHHRVEKAKDFLNLAIQIGLPDYTEYQFAQWQLR